MLALLHRLLQLLLVIAQQRMDFTMRFVTDSVNLRTERLARSARSNKMSRSHSTRSAMRYATKSTKSLL